MGDYKLADARFTAIYLRLPQHGKEDDLFELVPFELVRFNVDENPSAEAVIVPIGQKISVNPSGTPPDHAKIYEKIWIVDQVPFAPGAGGKVWFGNPDK